jgi:hypothetical protein
MARLRLRTILALLAFAAAGLGFKFYAGVARAWFNDYGAGVLYEVFWILVGFFLWPSEKAAARVPIVVFAATCVLEVMQLWHPPLLERIRATFLGAAVLGTTFDWLDFPHYAAGSLLGWVVVRTLARCRPN